MSDEKKESDDLIEIKAKVEKIFHSLEDIKSTYKKDDSAEIFEIKTKVENIFLLLEHVKCNLEKHKEEETIAESIGMLQKAFKIISSICRGR